MNKDKNYNKEQKAKAEEFKQKVDGILKEQKANEIDDLKQDIKKILSENPNFAHFMKEFTSNINNLNEKDKKTVLRSFSSLANSFMKSSKENTDNMNEQDIESKKPLDKNELDDLTEKISELMKLDNNFFKCMSDLVKAYKDMPKDGFKKMLDALEKKLPTLARIAVKSITSYAHLVYSQSQQQCR